MAYRKFIDGMEIRYSGGILFEDGRQVICPSEEWLLNHGWEVIEEPQPDYLEKAKRDKAADILQHDSSADVNECFISYGGNTYSYWASKQDRSSLKDAVNDFIDAGFSSYRLDLRGLGLCLTIPCVTILDLLRQMEVYAVQCYNKTSDHLLNVQNMTSVEDVEGYDYTVGYPEKLTFTIS